MRGAVDRAREWFFDVLEFVLETFAETIPRILRRVTLVLVLSGATLVGLGVLAVVDQALFVKVAYYAMAAAFVLVGGGLVWVAWRIHEMTASLRTLARLAKRWRERFARRE
jgi:cytochrome c biogenesis factor